MPIIGKNAVLYVTTRESDKMTKKNRAVAFAILAAALYGVNIPFSKVLMKNIGPTMMAAFLYLGAGAGLFIYGIIFGSKGKGSSNELLTKRELPYTLAMILLDIAAPILLMLGVRSTASANVSLLNNFEIVATSVIALVIFGEIISKRLWIAIFLVTLASIMLSFEGEYSFSFNTGSLFVIGACICWGFENNCTRMLSSKSSVEITTLKGCFSGLGSLIIAIIVGEELPNMTYIAAAMLLGFVSYGLSINFYILAQKNLGAAKTSAYYSAAPFIGAAFSMLLLGERPNAVFYGAMLIMIAATALMVKDTIALQHTHEHMHTHIHQHRHGDVVHTHEHTHIHSHMHVHEHGEETHGHSHTNKELIDHNHAHI